MSRSRRRTTAAGGRTSRRRPSSSRRRAGSRNCRCCSSRDAPELAGRALQLLALCADSGYASDLAKRGASGALLARLVAELRNKKTSQNTLVPRILSLLETLAPAAAAEDSQSETEEDSNEAGHLETLVEGLKDESVASALARTPALRKLFVGCYQLSLWSQRRRHAGVDGGPVI